MKRRARITIWLINSNGRIWQGKAYNGEGHCFFFVRQRSGSRS